MTPSTSRSQVKDRVWAVLSRSQRSTKSLARRLGQALEPGAVIGLIGELGAGKTTFVQGLAEGLGVAASTKVVSPTYALVNEYRTDGGALVHVDLYRLDDTSELRALGIEEQIHRGDAVVAVEWADKMPELMPPQTIWIRLSWEESQGRRISVEGLAKPKGLRLRAL